MAVRSAFVCEQGRRLHVSNQGSRAERYARRAFDHFDLKDSYRDLHFTDERTGDSYRAFIQIDGVGQVGRCDYHLYRNGAPITDGRKDSYVEAVTQLFGSLSLYLRSAFVSQKATKQNPELSDATKGEKKALFRELAGLDYLQLYADAAKEKAKDLMGDGQEPTEAALKIFYFVRDGISFGLYYPNAKASTTLAHGSGFCMTKTNLQMALLRAAGIPSRCHLVQIPKEVNQSWVPPFAFNRTPDLIVHSASSPWP